MAPAGPLPEAGPGRFAVALGAFVATPLLALAALWAADGASARGVAAAGACVLAASAALAAVWRADVARVADTLRRVAAGAAPAPHPPRLPSMEEIASGIERLAATLRAREAQVGRLVEADAAIVRSLPDPVVVLGPDREALRTNPAARTALGEDLAAVLRHPLLRGAVERAFETGRSQAATLSIPVPVERALAVTVVPVDPPLADGGRAIAVLSDRTREHAAERTRADFVTNASHELRTPLAGLIGFIDTLRGPAADDPAAQARFLAIMAAQAARMNRLIDDLLALARIEMTEHEAPRGEVDPGEAVRRAAAGFGPRLAGRPVTLDVQADAALAPVPGDADQIMQVLTNLIENAIRYGREGGTVRVSAAAASGAPWPARPGVTFTIADEGAGIAREHLPRLTERFYRVDQARSREAGGTGLGLAIVKHIVSRHRGRLAIDSREGHGTTVRVWLPAHEATRRRTTPTGGNDD